MTDYQLFHDEVSLGGVLISRGFIGEGLHVLVSEDLDVGAPVSHVLVVFGLVAGHGFAPLGSGVGVGHVDVLGSGDEGGVSVAPDDSLVPHEVVVNELAA